MNRIMEMRKARGWTLQKLADDIGTTKSQIDKLEKGYRRLTVDWMVRIARAFKCDPRDLMGPEAVARSVDVVKMGESKGNTIPVRGFKSGRLMPSPVDYVPRPYFLQHVKEAYGLYVPDDSMSPVYKAKQLLFVNPYKIPAAGNGVVIVDKDGDVLVREFVKQNANGATVRSYKPKAKDVTLPAGEFEALHVVAAVVEG